MDGENERAQKTVGCVMTAERQTSGIASVASPLRQTNTEGLDVPAADSDPTESLRDRWPAATSTSRAIRADMMQQAFKGHLNRLEDEGSSIKLPLLPLWWLLCTRQGSKLKPYDPKSHTAEQI